MKPHLRFKNNILGSEIINKTGSRLPKNRNTETTNHQTILNNVNKG